MEIIIFISVLIFSILILFARFCLTYYSTKDPRLSEEEKNKLNEKAKKQEFTLYIFNLIFSVIEIIILYEYIKLFVLIPIFVIGISVILRAIKKIKLSNILCGIIIVPAILFSIGYFTYDSITIITTPHTNGPIRDFDPTAFNTKFSQYEGKKNSAQVKTLIRDCLSSNVNEENINRLISVAFYKKDASGNYPKEPIYILGGNPSKNNDRR